MSEIKQFWICHCDFIPNRAFDNAKKCSSGCDYEPTHVLDVSSAREMYEALKYISEEIDAGCWYNAQDKADLLLNKFKPIFEKE